MDNQGSLDMHLIKRMLKPRQLSTLQKRQENRNVTMADLRSARPIAGLPGLGSEFWKATTAHLLNDVDSVAAQCLVPSTSEGTLVSDIVAQNLIQHWSAFFPLAKDCPKYTTMFEKAEVGTIAGFTALNCSVSFFWFSGWISHLR